MANTITVTACDNQIIFYAFQSDCSYEILHIQSGNSNTVDVTLNITAGTFSGCIELNGITSTLSVTDTVSLPSGDYKVGFVGINWDGTPQFTGTINAYSFNSGTSTSATGPVYGLTAHDPAVILSVY